MTERREGSGEPGGSGAAETGHGEPTGPAASEPTGPSATGPTGPSDRRRRGLETMAAVYGWEVQDGPGDFFGYTVEHLFGEIWNREGLSFRDRRLLLIGLMVGAGLEDVTPIQLGAALGNGELGPEELREIVVFLTHYAGWPRGAKLNQQVEEVLAAQTRDRDR